jgi:hypothetical protein
MAIAEDLPGRTSDATKLHGARLGLKRCQPGLAMTGDEDGTLRAGVGAGETWKAIAAKPPGRTAHGARSTRSV